MPMSPVRITAAALFATAALVACRPETNPSGDVAAGPARGGAERIVIVDSKFDPDVLELPAGTTATLEIVNEDDTAHDFAVDSLDLNTGNLEPGEAATATLTVPDGTTDFRCTYHDGMDGRIEAR